MKFRLTTTIRGSFLLNMSLLHVRTFTRQMTSTKASLRTKLLPITAIRLFSSQTDTIYSISTGPVIKSGISVIRTSGPHAKYLLQRLMKTDSQELIKPRRPLLRSLFCPISDLILDKALVLYFPSPHSFTGEDVVEFHVHGSVAVVTGVLDAFESLGKEMKTGQIDRGGLIRPAEAGEFTKRAFYNGKMDLTEIEGLADLLDAQTGLQRAQALSQMEGHLKVKFEKWREDIVHCLAHMEAVIDFGDDDRESDVSDNACNPLYPILDKLLKDLGSHLQDGRRGEIIREGFRIVLVGPPNAGKSSILNAMARRPAAIVSSEPGTTRDLIDVKMNIGGVCCLLTDTAGLRTENGVGAKRDEVDNLSRIGPVEVEGMRRTREALSTADLIVFVCDSSDQSSVRAMEQMLVEHSVNIKESKVMILNNKIDLINRISDSETTGKQNIRSNQQFQISCSTGLGMKAFEDALEREVLSALSPRSLILNGDDSGSSNSARRLQDRLSGITRQRHRFHIEQCIYHLERFLGKNNHEDDEKKEETLFDENLLLPLDLRAEELRLASLELGRVTGRVDVEELLDIIFRDFCIGK